MWLPGGVVYLVAALALLTTWLNGGDQPALAGTAGTGKAALLYERAGFRSASPPRTVDDLVTAGVYADESLGSLADTITTYWYSGIYGSGDREQVATYMRHLPNDFRTRSLYGFGTDWPISYDDLEPWYGEAEHELGVTGDSGDDLGSPQSRSFPMRALPPTYLDTRLSLTLAPLGLGVRVTPQARNSRFYQGRPPCCGNATCVPICPVAVKYDAATVHGKLVERYGGRILESSVVHVVEVGPDGLVTAVGFKRPDGSEHRALVGTYRMGADPQTSVVNAQQRSHDHPNLFLLGSGVFPTVGTANPTLTLAALALWAGDTIARKLGRVPVPADGEADAP